MPAPTTRAAARKRAIDAFMPPLTPLATQRLAREPAVQTDCFAYRRPVIVPARTFLSQLP